MKKAKKIFCKTCKYIINTITAIMGTVFLVSACALDSESIIPFIACAVSFVWCAAYLYLSEAFASDGEWVVIDDED